MHKVDLLRFRIQLSHGKNSTMTFLLFLVALVLVVVGTTSTYSNNDQIPGRSSTAVLVHAFSSLQPSLSSSSQRSKRPSLKVKTVTTGAALRSRSSSSSSISISISSDDDSDIDLDYDGYEDLCAAIIVPGFLTGADEFRPLANELTKIGIPTIPLMMPNWHWLPCLGGRSARPILERIDYTARWLIANDGDITKPIPNYQYSLKDVWIDFRTNPGGVALVGGSSKVDEYPIVEPQGKFSLPPESDLYLEPSPEDGGEKSMKRRRKKRIAIIAHSAGGWISRVFLSTKPYGGKIYDGTKLVHTLITLGTPHANAPGPAFEGIAWVNRLPKNNNGTDVESPLPKVRSLAVAGKGFGGGDWGTLTQNSYSFCCPDGSDGIQYDGDGVTPVFSALAFEDAEPLLLDGVSHFAWSDVFGGSFVAPELTKDHKNGRPWYGSPEIVKTWAKFILDHIASCNMKNNIDEDDQPTD